VPTSTPSPRRYLLTGALGAIGAWVARALLERGHEVVALDLGGSRHRLAIAFDGDVPQERLDLVQADIADLDGLERLLGDRAIERVVHLAALQVPFVRERPALGAVVNVVGTVNVLEAARRAGLTAPVVYASSIAALDAAGGGDVPLTLYGVYKRANEQTAFRFFEDYGVSSIGLRPHTVYGPGRDQGLTSAPTAALLAAVAGEPYEIPFGGRLQLQYLPDVAEAFVRASELDVRGASVHTLDGPSASVAEIVALVETATGAATGAIGWRGEPLPFPARSTAARSWSCSAAPSTGRSPRGSPTRRRASAACSTAGSWPRRQPR
jgi:nucleoside-diphosphate-sugar epimerase